VIIFLISRYKRIILDPSITMLCLNPGMGSPARRAWPKAGCLGQAQALLFSPWPGLKAKESPTHVFLAFIRKICIIFCYFTPKICYLLFLNVKIDIFLGHGSGLDGPGFAISRPGFAKPIPKPGLNRSMPRFSYAVT
jgi:hypothetical protein